jgi:hypothetical protein
MYLCVLNKKLYTLLTHTTKKARIPDMLLGRAARSHLQGESYFPVGLFAEKDSPYILNYNVIYMPFDFEHFKIMVHGF